MEWATLPLKRYAEFSGRSRRKEYWMFILLYVAAIIAAGTVETMLALGNMIGFYGPLTLLVVLGFFVPSLSVAIRRLHDTGRSGWWLLLGFVPIIGGIVLLVFMVLEGTRGPNEYGPDPKGGVEGAAAAA
jgi:uncharacterized membrane protein YhaH (DUF805 family)